MTERYVKDDGGNDVECSVAYCRISLPTVTLYLYCTAVIYIYIYIYIYISRQYKLGSRCYKKITSTDRKFRSPFF